MPGETMQLEERPDVPAAAIKAAASAWGMKAITFAAFIYAVVQGIVIIVGGEPRFAADGYEAARAIPGSPESVGTMLLMCGVAIGGGIVLRKDWFMEVGMYLAGAWSFGFAVTFLISANKHPYANTTAILSYLFISFMLVLPAVISHSSHPKRVHKHG